MHMEFDCIDTALVRRPPFTKLPPITPLLHNVLCEDKPLKKTPLYTPKPDCSEKPPPPTRRDIPHIETNAF
eukprot:4778663-Amphidinium_carterae.1